MTTITQVLRQELGNDAYQEIVNGDRRKEQILRDIPNPWVIFEGLPSRPMRLTNDMNGLHLCLSFSARDNEEVERVGIVTANAHGGSTIRVSALDAEPTDNWATLIAQRIGRMDHLVLAVFVTRNITWIFRRSGGNLDDVLNSALHAN